MVNEELIAAIRNALSRKEGIEKAKQSLVNAGYNKFQVDEAANAVLQAEKTGIEGTIVPVAGSVNTSPFSEKTEKSHEKEPKKNVLSSLTADKKKLILIMLLSAVALAIATTLILLFI